MEQIKIEIERLYNDFRIKIIDIVTTDEYNLLPKLSGEGCIDIYDLLLLIDEKIPTTNNNDVLNGLKEILNYKKLVLTEHKINKIFPIFLELIKDVKEITN